MKEKLNKLFLIFYVWTVGLFGGILFWLLRMLGRIKIEGYKLKKLIPTKEGLVVVSNHPSLYEPAILPFLFSPWYLFSLKMIPFSTPDRKNYYDKWWFIPFRSVCIPVEREKEKWTNSLRRLVQAIKEGKTIILFPEGTRTCNGREFKVFEEGEIKIKTDWEEVKNCSIKIARFQPGVSYLLKNKTILPIWVEGTDKVMPNRPMERKREKHLSKRFSFPEGFCFPLPRIWKKTTIKLGESKNSRDLSLEELENILLKTGAI